MNISQALIYLDTLAKWKGGPHAGLGPVSAVARCMGDPQDAVKTIHITGTNGKGSVATYVASSIAHSGLKTALFTSPHISEVNERIMIDGKPVRDDILAAAVYAVRSASEQADVQLSYFEAMTLCGFEVCRALKVDYGIFEVGLGGKLDATNIISKPEVAVITTIALDHQHLLGDTLEAIASDKSGIIKRNCVVVAGSISEGPLNVLREAVNAQNAKLYVYGEDFSEQSIEVDIRPGLNGKYQFVNAAVAAKVCGIIGISNKSVEEGIARAFWPARLEWIKGLSRPVLFDSAHNLAAMETVVDYLVEQGINEVDILFGVVATKNWKDMIRVVAPRVRQWNLLQPCFASPVSGEELGAYLSSIGISARDFQIDYDRACKELIVKSEQPLLVVGSIYMAAEVRKRIAGEVTKLW